jgi:cytoskeletal protein CcmA (bactofilin family)
MSSTVRPSAPNKHTVVEEGSSFKGTLTSSCPIHVHGRIEGDLQTPALTVSATGVVHGKVKVGMVRSQGELAGEFDADSVELAGTVRDNTVIRARSLEVKLASARGKLQVIFGDCELSVGDEPTEHDAVEPPQLADAAPAPAALPMEAAVQAAAESEMVAAVQAAAESEMLAAIQAAVVSEGAAASAPEQIEPADEDSEEEEVIEADALDAPAQGGKRRRKRKHAEGDVPRTGWSQPPSQPPPAN